MSRIHLRDLALVLGAAALATSCAEPPGTVLLLDGAARGDAFNSYVAIGNSITAGYQSSGITDSVQRRSYAFLLSQSFGTRFAYPSIAGRGCPPLIGNFQTQARTTGTAATCDLRASAVDILNNVAVPGAWSGDPTSSSSANSNPLTTIFLGGKTQVEKALSAKPTFVSVWIGNNDVLGPAISSGGTAASLATITGQTAFQTNYDAVVDPLVAQNPNLKGVLIGVVKVTRAPIMFPVANLTGATKLGFDAIACGAATSACFATGVTIIDLSCTTGAGPQSLINTFLAFQIRLGAHGATVACTPGGSAGTLPAPTGDAFVLTTTEQATVDAAVDAYNAYIAAKATTLGFAYFNPDSALVSLKTGNTIIRQVPNYGSGTNPFGTGMSLDGVHPAASIHLTLANLMIAKINEKYTLTLPNVF